VALSVWPVAQTCHRAQRIGRYLPCSAAHPARMLAALARHVIERHSAPGELVVDPMRHRHHPGGGRAPRPGRGRGRAGARWADLAERNLARAMSDGAAGIGSVIPGDARQLARLLAGQVDGGAALVLTSPPFGAWAHGRVHAGRGQGKVTKWNAKYTSHANRANLATAGETALLDGMVEILAASTKVLRPGGLVVLTARPWRRGGGLVDFPGALEQAAEQAGLMSVDRAVALLAGLREQRLVPRASFFALDNTRKHRAAGLPVHVIAHEDVLEAATPTRIRTSTWPNARSGWASASDHRLGDYRRDQPERRAGGEAGDRDSPVAPVWPEVGEHPPCQAPVPPRLGFVLTPVDLHAGADAVTCHARSLTPLVRPG
jgi:modification methylase